IPPGGAAQVRVAVDGERSRLLAEAAPGRPVLAIATAPRAAVAAESLAPPPGARAAAAPPPRAAVAAAAPEQQDALLTLAMADSLPGGALFFDRFRQLVVTGYYTSEIGMTEEREYLPVPGAYDGAYPYAQVTKVWSS
ncbi:MAG: gluconate 2-dehydrogenase subunit 3 family protein, partial [Allosphingosinicella sp.]